ncbi:MAG TPA: membrane protein insertion efficiency factor YidD [Oculatellaceae cyanobacterium]|jgi:hypothetical protein
MSLVCPAYPSAALYGIGQVSSGPKPASKGQVIRFGLTQAASSETATCQVETPVPLSKGQQVCDRMIAWYQKVTRESKLAARLGRQETGIFGCGIKQQGLSEYSCSEYTREAIRRHGVIKGIIKGFFRILMCNPITFHCKPLQRFFMVP